MSESDVDTSVPEHRAPTSLARGISVIREALRTMPPGPGVYRMLDRRGDALYVGKARSLKSRVGHYTNTGNLSTRLSRMVAETHAMEVVVTHTELWFARPSNFRSSF